MNLSPQLLLAAYTQGIFPMADEGQIYWYDPDPRAIIPLETFHVPRSLRRRIRQKTFEIRVDTAFTEVMQHCASERPETWISDEFIQVYSQLHRMGLAHSVETYQAGELVGGLYGVAVRGLFAGESMFSLATDASKVALVHLVARLKLGEYTILDSQFYTPHLARFGLVEIPRHVYQERLAQALRVEADFYSTNMEHINAVMEGL